MSLGGGLVFSNASFIIFFSSCSLIRSVHYTSLISFVLFPHAFIILYKFICTPIDYVPTGHTMHFLNLRAAKVRRVVVECDFLVLSFQQVGLNSQLSCRQLQILNFYRVLLPDLAGLDSLA